MSEEKMTAEEYKIRSMEFKGRDSVGNYGYLLHFNKSLVHIGRLSDIEDGLNKDSKLQQIIEEVEGLKFDEDYKGMEGSYIAGNNEAIDEVISILKQQIE